MSEAVGTLAQAAFQKHFAEREEARAEELSKRLLGFRALLATCSDEELLGVFLAYEAVRK